MAEEDHQKMLEHLDNPFIPVYSFGSKPSAESRVANALEYIAYQMGEIRRHMREINDTLKTRR